MSTVLIKTTQKVEPKCYAYTTPEIIRHNGMTKIGYTEQNVDARIRQQTQTADVRWQKEWEHRAIFSDGERFTDKDFHAYLAKKEIRREPKNEWFHILPKEAEQHFFDFRENKGENSKDKIEVQDFTLRQEQEDAVLKTAAYFEQHAGQQPEFLWNAKPRFGKTLATYELCRLMGVNSVLIVTNRPVIANSWYKDYVKFLGTQSGFWFESETDALKGELHVLTHEQVRENPDIEKVIRFVSLQDLKGAKQAGGKFDKLHHLFNTNIDLLVIDEAHEGVDTWKTDVALDQIKRKYTLHLSGTPFKALAREKFPAEAIFNWTYEDEQERKANWAPANEGENPYAALPRLNLFTYKMSDIVQTKLAEGRDFDNDGKNELYAFDLNEFFKVKSGGIFEHDAEVDRFLDALTTQHKFPFSTPELRDEIKHSFWLLNRVASAKALARKLKEHPVFRDYKVVIAAGDGKPDAEQEYEQEAEADVDKIQKAYDKVIAAIKKHDKTITLSVGQLTTGVTVEEWTAVLMLNNLSSPAQYMQAAFRAQNPCLFEVKEEDGTTALHRKTDAYVFDFDPARVLKTYAAFANNLGQDNTGTSQGQQANVRKLINFFPVYAEDDKGEMIELDAAKVLSLPNRIYAKEIVRRGFMCNLLFVDNLVNLFKSSPGVKDILNRIKPANKQPFKPVGNDADNLETDETGEIAVSEENVIGTAKELFGKAIYQSNPVAQEIKRWDQGDPLELARRVEALFNEDLPQTIVQEGINRYHEKAPDKKLDKRTLNKVQRDIQQQAERTLATEQQRLTNDLEQIDQQYEAKLAEAEQSGASQEQQMELLEQQEKERDKRAREFINTMQQETDELIRYGRLELVKGVETEAQQDIKDKEESTVRDHLRGLSRAIPSFLMAFGNRDTTLQTFDKGIPTEDFEDVTGISLDMFLLLRDGGDYQREDGTVEHIDGHFFIEDRFNHAVQEFFDTKAKLANYFDETQQEDIFDYIPDQKTNQIFTPKKVVREMVDMLQEQTPGCFDNPEHTFIDLHMKSGLYIAEIVKRLFNSKALKRQFPDEGQRLRHIFAKQVFGLAPTQTIYHIVKNFLLGFDETMSVEQHNLRHCETYKLIQEGRLEVELDTLFR